MLGTAIGSRAAFNVPRTAFAATDGQQLQVLHSRIGCSAERPQVSCQAQAAETSNRSSFPITDFEELDEAEAVWADEGSLVPLADEYTEANRTLPINILSTEEVLEAMQSSVHENAQNYYHSFFSSELGGVTTDRAFMQIPMDDHLVHRGHGVFDTALIVNGYAYMLDEHLERLRISAKKAAIPLPVSIKQLKRVILETVAVSMKMNGLVRFWLGAGRGDFGISTKGCLGSSFYCLMTTLPEGDPTYHPGSDYLKGKTVRMSTVPIKDPYFATLKSVNYLQNALACLDGEQHGADYGIFVDEDGNIAEGPNMNMIILTHEGELVIPPFSQTLAGLTLRRIMELIPEQIEELIKDTGGQLQTVSQRRFNKWEVYDCKEAMLIGSTTYVTSIVKFEDKDIGDGPYGNEPGTVSLTLRAMLQNDMNPEKGPRRLFSEVPYGFLTNM